MLRTGPYQVSLKQQIRFNSQILGNKQCRYNEGPLYSDYGCTSMFFPHFLQREIIFVISYLPLLTVYSFQK